MKKGALFLNGQFEEIKIERQYDFVVACDGGYLNAVKIGIFPSIVVGDFDSMDKSSLSEVEIKEFPKEKDFTDGEYGLKLLVESGCEEIDIYFGLGKRLSHTMGNLQMANKYIDKVKIVFYGMEEKVFLMSKSFDMKEKVGTTISLVPFSESVHIISSKGLKYPLENLILKNHEARGLSNETISDVQEIILKSGSVLVAIWEE